MTRRTIRFGILIGLAGGGAMALFAMTAMWASGHGFFTIVNLFAHTFWSDAPLDGTFTVASFELGLLIHLAMSFVIGTVIAYLVERGQLDAGVVVLMGVGVGACAWVVQAFAWTALDPAAHGTFTPWILATAHMAFALGAATVLTWLERHDRTATDDVARQEPEPVTITPVLPRPTRSGFSRPLRFDPDAVD